MKRFFGTSAVLRRIPPGAPAHVKEIPIPRTARTTEDIRKYVEASPSEPAAPAVPKPRSLFPEADPQLLAQPSGVWYHVARSRSNNLPVYTDFNNAGGVWTEVRKVSGNVGALRNDLQKALGLTKHEIWVKNAAQVVVIKGNRRAAVKELLSTVF